MMYGAIVKGYDELHGAEQLRKLSVIAAELRLGRDDVALDVGCGTGLGASLGCRVVGIDSSMEMVLESSRRIESVHGFAETLPFPDGSFDAVICVSAIHNFTSPLDAVREMRRVSRGSVVITLLRRSARFRELDSLLRESLDVVKVIRDAADTVYFCRR